MNGNLVQQQFGAHAEAYATSIVHAKGASLSRLVEVVHPQHDWRMLDIATGAGHTAITFAPHVAQVVASDITPEMLTVAARLAGEKGLLNITFEEANAEALPFADATFHLVTCRIAPHHFADVAQFVRESVRVMRPGGVLAVVDNVVPAAEAGVYVNNFERLRDPSHVRCLALEEWVSLLSDAGLTVTTAETATKSIQFNDWWARQGVAPEAAVTLRKMLLEAKGDAAAYLAPAEVDGVLYFQLLEAIVVGVKSNPTS